jgi:branched-chain amino acid transport system permease protein
MIAQILFNGLVAGCLYILSGISFGLVYSSTGVFHFANVSVYTVGGLSFYQFYAIWNFPFFISLILGLCCAAIINVSMEWICYMPLREKKASALQVFLTSVGLAFVLQNIYLLIWKSDPHVVPISETLLYGRQMGSIRITYLQIITLVLVPILWLVLHSFMSKTKIGKAIRAFAADPSTAELMGINTRWVRIVVFAIGSTLIAVVAQLQIMDLGIDVNSGFNIVIIGTIAALFGGRWGITGIAIVSLLLGIIENAAMILLSAQWKYVVLFGIVIILLYLKPKAIFGD